jgi:hypothetical protein
MSLFATCLLAGSAYAQNDAKPLDLSVPPSIGFPVPKTASVAPASTVPVCAAPALLPA